MEHTKSRSTDEERAAMGADLDQVDVAMLDLLQEDGRASIAQLGRDLGLSHSTVTERLRRLRERGVLQGVAARVDLTALGLSIEAVVRVATFPRSATAFVTWAKDCPNVLWCAHVMGEDCFVLHLTCRTVPDLEELLGRLGTYGTTSSSLVLSTPIERRGAGLKRLGV
jgi:Lrp/AsnC family leucine-responsive transcriptional regulator